MNAQDLMSPHEVWVCSETDDCRRVAQLIVEHDVGAIPVLDELGRIEGIVTDRDICCRIVAEGRSFETPAREIMTSPVCTCSPYADLKEIEAIMREHKVRRLPVVDANNKLQGFISLGDLARHCHGLWKEHRLAEVLESVSTPS